MKINFEGTFDEFQALFRGGAPAFQTSEFSEPPTAASWGDNGTAIGPFTMPVPAAQPLPDGDFKGPRVGWEKEGEPLPTPDNDPTLGQKLNLPGISAEQREDAWEHFVGFCAAWVVGFEQTETVPAPDVVDPDENGMIVRDATGARRMKKALDQDGNQITVERGLADQPDRLSMMQELGHGRWPVPTLVMAYEKGSFESLQRMVEKALHDSGYLGQWPAAFDPTDEKFESDREAWLDFVDRLSATMVQVSHMGFPDLAGTYDYSTRWRRS